MELLTAWFKRSFSDPQVVILGVFLVIGFAIIIGLGKWLAPMFASIVIAYLLEAVVSRLQKTGLPRLASVIIVYILFITVFLFLTFGLVPIVIRQLTALVQQFPNYIAQGQELLKQLPQNYPNLISEGQIQAIISQLGQEMAVWVQQALSWSLASVASVISLVVYLVLVPVLIFFLLKDKDLMIGWLSNYLPRERTLVNGLSRLATRFLGEPGAMESALQSQGEFDAVAAEEAGLVTYAPDDIDWEDEVRLAVEERASLSPDALTGME